MHTILIVDDENPFLLSLKDGLASHNDQLNILMANDGEEAVRIIQRNEIDLLVTDLKLPIMDGFELLAYINSNNPYMPVIVMTAFGTSEIEEQLSDINALHYLEKPLDFDMLVQTIDAALTKDTNSYIRGITLSTFLQLIHMENKSCSLSVHSREESGELHIENGEMIHASSGELTGKEAALRIIGWDNTEIEMNASCQSENRSISDPIGFILMEAHRIKDENNLTRTDDRPSSASLIADNIPVAQQESSLLRFLKNCSDIKEYAIFNEGNHLEQISTTPCSLANLDPAYYLSTCSSAGSLSGESKLNYLLFTTSDNQRYMILGWWSQRAILSLRSTAQPTKLYLELQSIMEKEISTHYRRGPDATTH